MVLLFPPFDVDPQPIERPVPLASDPVQIAMYLGQSLRSELEDPLPTAAPALGQARALQHMEMLGNGLTGDGSTHSESGDRLRAMTRETRHELETHRIAQRRKERRRPLDPLDLRHGRHGRASRHVARARYFSISVIWPAQPCSFISKALARRSSGTPSKPDSVTVNSVSPSTSSSTSSTRVLGSPE